MTITLAVWFAQQSARPLSDNEVRFLLWVSSGMGGLLFVLIGFSVRQILKRMDEFAEDRKEVVKQLDLARLAWSDEIKDVWAKLYEWNGVTAQALAEQTIAIEKVDSRLGRMEDRIPARAKPR